MRPPITLFAYRRPLHLARTLHALRANPQARESKLFIFADAPRDADAEQGVGQVRKLLQKVDGFADVDVTFRPENFGLARNIMGGVSDVLSRFNDTIVVEDDVVVSPHFLKYMNEALALYRDEPRVGSISGYCFPISGAPSETYFIRGADCWGWATWADRWASFDSNGPRLLAELRQRNLAAAFDLDGAMPFIKMLEDQIAARNDSWAVRWHAHCFLRDLLILYPGRALAHNIGNDGSGTHSLVADDSLAVALSPVPVAVGGIPVEELLEARAAIRDFLLQSTSQPADHAPVAPSGARGGLISQLLGRMGLRGST